MLLGNNVGNNRLLSYPYQFTTSTVEAPLLPNVR